MAEATNTTAAQPPAALDMTAVQKAIADAMKPVTDSLAALTSNQKVIADTMAADAKAKAEPARQTDAAKAKPADGKEPASPAPLTAEQVSKLVNDGVAAVLKQRDEAAQSSAQRDAFVGEKLKGLPAVYQAKLGSDPAKWAAEEQSIRDQFKADLTAAGAKLPDVGGGDPGGKSAGDAAAAAAKPNNMGLTDGQAAFARGLKLPS